MPTLVYYLKVDQMTSLIPTPNDESLEVSTVFDNVDEQVEAIEKNKTPRVF